MQESYVLNNVQLLYKLSISGVRISPLHTGLKDTAMTGQTAELAQQLEA